MVSVHWDTARMVVAMMKEIRSGGDRARLWLEQLNEPRFSPVLHSCGRWDEGRHHPLPPDRLLYVLFNAWQDRGNLQLPPEQSHLQAHLQRAYRELDRLEQALEHYSGSLEQQLAATVEREVTSWLPRPVDLDCKVEITLGTPMLGFAAAGAIYLDLLALAELGQQRAEQYIAHHLFHFCHKRLAEGNTADDRLWRCLFSFQGEGVVNHVIGGSREMLELRYKYATGPLRDRLLRRLEHYAAFAREPEPYFEKLYQLLEEALVGTPASLAQYCRDVDPGHYQGVAVAGTIEQRLGAAALRETLCQPVDFLLAWANTDGGGYPPLPAKLAKLLEQYKLALGS